MSELTYIIESLRPLAIPIDSCHPDPANARKGHAVDRIAGSLAQYKQRKPIVVNASEGNKIEAGNGTWLAAKSLGWTHIAAVIVEDDPMTAVGYGIADNRLGHLSEWDIETLATLLDSIDADLPTGFEGDELNEILEELYGSLPSAEPANDPAELWAGMPEFENEPKAARTLYVHFADNEDVQAFARLVGQDITDKTRALWYPYRIENLHMDKSLVYTHES